MGKILHVNAGHVLSCQYHTIKDETLHVLRGEVILRLGRGDDTAEIRFRAGDSMHIPAGLVHQMEAVTDTDVLEASTPELDDLVRASKTVTEGADRMQVIIPLAGKGTRLRPHTHLVPKPMLKVAGRPVMDWVMDRLDGLDVDRAHLHHRASQGAGRGLLQRPLRRFPAATSSRPCRTAPRARSTSPARSSTGPVLIIFVDTVFEADLALINRTDADGIIWAKEVEDYQRFGVVVTDADGYMTQIVEKPSEPISKLANIGLYYIRAVDSLWQGIDHVLAAPANKGEYYLTDAFQWMIEQGGASWPPRSGAGTTAASSTRCSRPTRSCSGRAPRAAPELSRRRPSRAGAHRGRRHDRADHHRPQRDDRDGHDHPGFGPRPHYRR